MSGPVTGQDWRKLATSRPLIATALRVLRRELGGDDAVAEETARRTLAAVDEDLAGEFVITARRDALDLEQRAQLAEASGVVDELNDAARPVWEAGRAAGRREGEEEASGRLLGYHRRQTLDVVGMLLDVTVEASDLANASRRRVAGAALRLLAFTPGSGSGELASILAAGRRVMYPAGTASPSTPDFDEFDGIRDRVLVFLEALGGRP